MRRLFTIRRQVALDRADEYLAAWDDVRAGVEQAGGRAWVFHGAAHEDRFLEFIEWSGAAPPQDEPDVVAALERLDTFGAAIAAEEWEQSS